MSYNKLSFDDIKYLNINYRNLINSTKEEQEKYTKSYNTYRALLTDFLIKKLEIKKYEEKLSNSEFDIIKTKKSEDDIYQCFSFDELDYFYIRNNIYLDRLNSDESKYLNDISSEDNIQLNDKNESFINDTYKKVTKEIIKNIKEPYNVIFNFKNIQTDSKQFFAPNNSVVIGLRYDEIYPKTDEKITKKSIENLAKKSEFINNIIKEFENNSKEKIENKVKVIRYINYVIN